MDFTGFDLGKVSSQVCIITEGGELVERRVRTDREQIGKLLGGRRRARLRRGGCGLKQDERCQQAGCVTHDL